MDYIVHGVAKSWTRLSDFHFTSGGKIRGEKCLACKAVGKDGFPVNFPSKVCPSSLCPNNDTPNPLAQALRISAWKHVVHKVRKLSRRLTGQLPYCLDMSLNKGYN